MRSPGEGVTGWPSTVRFVIVEPVKSAAPAPFLNTAPARVTTASAVISPPKSDSFVRSVPACADVPLCSVRPVTVAACARVPSAG
ncbi:MAG TPA: hypothetical protein VLJ76_10735 [Gaiellaceae bacterium]|nr:hypothetical protein [Gaiellaceae bacterium]